MYLIKNVFTKNIQPGAVVQKIKNFNINLYN